MRTLVLALLGYALWLQALASDTPPVRSASGSKEVDTLLLQLVSPKPAPHPDGYWLTTTKEDIAGGYMTPQVSNAIVKLKAMGPAIFPQLVPHLGDNRYSYSYISAAWQNCTVGDAIVMVLDDGHYMHSGYKSRKTPSGSGGVYPSFKGYLEVRGAEKWAEWAKNKSRFEIQMDFIDWCIEQENERGFVDEAQKKQVLGRYEAARQRMRKEYSEPNRPSDGSRPIRPK